MFLIHFALLIGPVMDVHYPIFCFLAVRIIRNVCLLILLY